MVLVFNIWFYATFFCYGRLYLQANGGGVKMNIENKFKRLIIPYFVYGLIFLFFSELLHEDTNFVHGLCGLLYGRYNLYPEGYSISYPLLEACRDICPLWFLPCMFLAYTWVTIYDNVSSVNKKIFFAASVLLSILSSYKTILLPWSVDTSFMAFLFILVGRYVKTKLRVDGTRKDLVYAILLLLGYVILCKLNPHVNFSIGKYGDLVPWSVFLFFGIGVIEPLFLSFGFRFLASSRITSMFAYFGRHSLRLLCIHIFIARIVGYYDSYILFTISLIAICFVDAVLELIYKNTREQMSLVKYL